jgi:hypothetical protein
LLSCGETVTQIGEADVTDLELSVTSTELAITRTLQLRAYPLDATGSLLVGLDVSWRSLNSLVATVDDDGLVAGVAAGTTSVIAQVGALADTATVIVDVLSALTLSADSVGLDGVAGDAVPARDSISITNTGGITLTGLRVDSIVYGPGASDWLTAVLDASIGPATLELTGITLGVTTTGVYVANVYVSATDATGSPAHVTVTIDVAPGVPASGALQIFAGNSQTAITGTSVTTSPTIILRDQFNNPVPNTTIAFSASGGGSVNPPTDVTDSNGQASTTWTVSVTGHTLGSDGTFLNTLTASATGLTSLQFGGFARYSYATHVNPIFAANCSGCHGSSGNQNFDGTPAQDYAMIVNVVPFCDATLGALYRRVSSAGGVAAADTYSILIRKLDNTIAGIGTCGAHGGGEVAPGTSFLEIFRAWIRNGAPNN